MRSKKIEINDAAVEIEEVAQEVIDTLVERGWQPGALPRVTACDLVSKTAAAPGLQPIGMDELASLYSLLAYVAHDQDVRQETVEAMLEAETGVRHISSIKQRDFERALVFLLELRVHDRKN
jgi:hypothetical protein